MIHLLFQRYYVNKTGILSTFPLPYPANKNSENDFCNDTDFITQGKKPVALHRVFSFIQNTFLKIPAYQFFEISGREKRLQRMLFLGRIYDRF